MHSFQEIQSAFTSKSFSKRNSIGLLILLWQILLTGLGIVLSIQAEIWLWLVGQIILGISFLQWFFLIHDLGHGTFIPNKKLSVLFGHIASLFCLIPYYPWKYIHQEHHKWTGWREMDPTVPDEPFEEMSRVQKRMVDFCWKYWIPLIALSYVATTFYNLKKLDQGFPQKTKRRNNRFSIIFIVVSYLLLLIVLGWLFIKVWLLAAVIFLSISDPYLLSQHTHLDSKDIEKNPLRPIPFVDQDHHSRTIRFPHFAEKFIFYYSNYHGFHHQYPWVSIYELGQLKNFNENEIHWLRWLKIAKSMPGHILIFRSFEHTGIRL